MLTRRSMLSVLSGAMLLCFAAPVAAQEIVTTGPPPELRKNLDAFQKAFSSGDAAQYEAMAKTAFTPEYLKQQTPEQRKAEYTKWFAAFGAIKFQQVMRNSPDAPLEITVKGAVASGLMWIDVDDETSKLAGVKAEAHKDPTNLHANRHH
jgi:hypothetical protein